MSEGHGDEGGREGWRVCCEAWRCWPVCRGLGGWVSVSVCVSDVCRTRSFSKMCEVGGREGGRRGLMGVVCRHGAGWVGLGVRVCVRWKAYQVLLKDLLCLVIKLLYVCGASLI